MDDPLREALDAALHTQYDILRLLGRGAMGAVYLGRERALDRLVAIKVLPPDTFSAPETLERFRREARVAAKLSHANILPLYSFGEVDGLGYYVMGYVHGESLDARLKAEGTLRAPEARRVLADIADALDYAHRQGVIHRDIKPANVLIEDESGRALLADFGIAKTHDTPDDALTHTGVSLGTPHYMSPEQAVGSRDLDGRSDIYSLGVLGYVMLAGREPFSAPNFQALVFKHIMEPAPSLSAAVPGVPDDLNAVVTRCMAKNAADRWQDGRSLKDALALDDGAESTTAPELRELSSFGTWAALWAAVWIGVAFLVNRRDVVLVLFLALLVPAGFVFHVWSIARKGLRPTLIIRASFWAPKWWGMWWPSPLRRPGDVWARLPPAARLVRIAASLLTIVIGVLVVERARISANSSASRWLTSDITAAAPFIAMFAIILVALWWGRRRGLSTTENFWLLFGPTAGTALWPTPHVARLLTPLDVPASRTGPRPESPHDFVRDIARLAQELSGPARAAGSEAALAARQLLDSIAQIDHEIADMQRDADPTDIARLEQRLATLRGAPASSAPQPKTHREMTSLLESELELVRRIAAQREPMMHRRAHLAGCLSGLWMRTVALRDASGDAAAELAATTNVRELCSSARHQAELVVASSS